MDRGAWQAAVHGVTHSWTQLSTSKQTTQEVYRSQSRGQPLRPSKQVSQEPKENAENAPTGFKGGCECKVNY